MFERIKKLLGFGKDNKDVNSEIISKMNKEIKQKTMQSLIAWEDIKPICFDKRKIEEDKTMIIVDDNYGAAKLIEEDIEKLDISKKTHSFVITDDYAPYRIQKTCDTETPELCEIDYAIIDIVFGTSILKDGEMLFLDGIDLAAYLFNKNPNVKLCLFTGCNLDANYSKEREKIVLLLGENFLENNVLDKTPNDEVRIDFLKRIFDD